MAAPIEPGFIPLFDGTSIADWRMCGPGRFVLDRERSLMRAEGGMGLLWYTPRMFRNFVLRLEWQENRRTDNSGVFFRFPDPGDDPWLAVREGYEIQIFDEWHDMRHVTGAVYDLEPASHVASRPLGEWNLFEITADGPVISVRLNGETVVPGYRGDRRPEGYVGVQNHDDESHVAFRNIRIREL
jgi:hypothetical protein